MRWPAAVDAVLARPCSLRRSGNDPTRGRPCDPATMTAVRHRTLSTPIGTLTIVCSDRGVVATIFDDEDRDLEPASSAGSGNAAATGVGSRPRDRGDGPARGAWLLRRSRHELSVPPDLSSSARDSDAECSRSSPRSPSASSGPTATSPAWREAHAPHEPPGAPRGLPDRALRAVSSGWCTRAARSAGTDATTTANAGSCGTRARRRERSRRPVVRPSVREDDVHDETPPARTVLGFALLTVACTATTVQTRGDVVRDRADQRRRLALGPGRELRPRGRLPERCRWGLLEHRGAGVRLLSFGEIDVAFSYLGGDGSQDPLEGPATTAEFVPARATNRATATGRRSRTRPRSRAST